jgi:hypothetical protein
MLSANGPGYSLVELIYEFGTIHFPWRGSTIAVETLNPRQLRYVQQKHLWFGWDTDQPHLNTGGHGQLPLAAAPYPAPALPARVGVVMFVLCHTDV